MHCAAGTSTRSVTDKEAGDEECSTKDTTTTI